MPEECYRTIKLLWPFSDVGVQKRLKSLQDREMIDLEAPALQAKGKELHDLKDYPFFGARLDRIQKEATRREAARSGKRTIQIALWGIVLTALFGLLSFITGAVSTWSGIKQLNLAIAQANNSTQA